MFEDSLVGLLLVPGDDFAQTDRSVETFTRIEGQVLGLPEASILGLDLSQSNHHLPTAVSCKRVRS